MNIWEILILTVIAAYACYVIVKKIKVYPTGSGCSCGCRRCTRQCGIERKNTK